MERELSVNLFAKPQNSNAFWASRLCAQDGRPLASFISTPKASWKCRGQSSCRPTPRAQSGDLRSVPIVGRVPPPSQPRGLRTQPAPSPAASSQRCPGSSACKFQCTARRRRGGGYPGSKKHKVCTRGAPPSAPVTSAAGRPASLAGGAAQRGGTHPPCPCRRRSEPLSPELSECKKDGGAYRETTHSSVWQPGGDSGSSALEEEEEEEGTAQSDAICCTPLRCHWLPGASREPRGSGHREPPCASPPPAAARRRPSRLPSPLHNLLLPLSPAALIRPPTRPPPPGEPPRTGLELQPLLLKTVFCNFEASGCRRGPDEGTPQPA